MDTGFLNSNLIRAYPFIVDQDRELPDWLMVDFRGVVLYGDYDPSIHHVYLAWVARLGNRVRFGFRTTAPDLSDQELVFERIVGGPKYETEFVYSQALTETLEQRCGCGDELLCNPSFGEPIVCNELLCNPDMDESCGPELVCNSNLEGELLSGGFVFANLDTHAGPEQIEIPQPPDTAI